MIRSRAVCRLACCVAGACCVASAAAAQGLRPAAEVLSAGITLEDAVRITLRENATIQIAARGVDIDRGALLATADPFDAKVSTGLGQTRLNVAQTNSDASRFTWTDTSQTQYSVGVDKQFRSGILVSPELVVSKIALPGLPIAPTSQATARLSVTVPLVKDRGGVATIAPERAAARTLESSRFQARHVASQAVLAAVTAYWDYQAAVLKLSVVDDSVVRAQRLYEDTGKLVEGGERPSADLPQVQGNVAAKRVTRTLAEQAVVDARVRLGLAIGLDAAETAALGTAVTPFPASESPTAPPDIVTPLAEAALAARPDLKAAAKNIESARVRFDAAADGLKPRFDLVSSIGYQGIQLGQSIATLVSPVYQNVPGPDLSFAFRYQRPTLNSSARGQLLQSESALEQARLAEKDLERQIRTGVYQASESIARNASAMTAAHEAVALYQASVNNEERKFQAGMSTLFDTINAADALVNARLSEIAARHDYAVALATLRFQTGSLVGASQPEPTVDVDRLLRLQ